jgi:hypothetical protein
MKNPQFNVYAHVVTGIDCAHVMVAALMYRSVWFTLTPLPDDEWEFLVKREDADHYLNLLRRCQ